MRDVRPSMARLASRLRLRPAASRQGKHLDRHQVGDYLLERIALRRRWALHRHVHLVHAFDQASNLDRIESVLSIGCGAGLSEIFLAASAPDVSFVLTDFDEERLNVAEHHVKKCGLHNVELRVLDLLISDTAPNVERFDFVSSIEVLEHIDDDETAAANYSRLSRQFLYVLVPSCCVADLTDEKKRRSAWERHEHFRPGYTEYTLTHLFSDTTIVSIGSCYLRPTALSTRMRLEAMSDDAIRSDWRELLDMAHADVGSPLVDCSRADGIELLARVC